MALVIGAAFISWRLPPAEPAAQPSLAK